jgi:hypothetical protein
VVDATAGAGVVCAVLVDALSVAVADATTAGAGSLLLLLLLPDISAGAVLWSAVADDALAAGTGIATRFAMARLTKDAMQTYMQQESHD